MEVPQWGRPACRDKLRSQRLNPYSNGSTTMGAKLDALIDKMFES